MARVSRSYWANCNPATTFTSAQPWFVRQDPQIDFEWGPTALPGPNISASIHHCMVWEGFIRLPAGSSSLRLRTNVTDGVRVYIDDALGC